MSHLSHDALIRQVDEFAREHELDDIKTLLHAGALVAQSPRDFESVTELEEDDKVALRRETTHKWSQPGALYFTIIICSLGAAVQ